jgi:ADP-heptose:LPS heptosyltransferase
LQRDENLIEGLPFADLRDQMKTWEDTASILAGLDLVITSCTSVAHCSAALGVETWIVVPTLPYYLWAVPTKTSVWYESVQLFRQKEYGKWDEPLNQIRSELEEKVKVKVAA